MPLSVLPAPAPALRSVLAALKSPSAGRQGSAAVLGPVRERLRCTRPLPVYELDQIGALVSPPHARLAGWRFQLRGEGPESGAVAAAEAMLTPDGWAFSHFSEGPYVASTERALRQADSLATAFQPRLLSVPELYMVTLWLHRDSAAGPESGDVAPGDLLVPLAPAPPGIPAHRPSRAGDLLPVLRHRLASAPLLGSPA